MYCTGIKKCSNLIILKIACALWAYACLKFVFCGYSGINENNIWFIVTVKGTVPEIINSKTWLFSFVYSLALELVQALL